MLFIAMISALVGCAKDRPPTVETPPTPAATPSEPVAPPDKPTANWTPDTLYGACRDRVEQPEVQGECEVDADCAPTGCSQEVCTTTAAGEGMMTTCGIEPCFQILDTCGCQSGVCSWALKAEVPPALQAMPKPKPGLMGGPPIPSGPQ